MSVVTPAGYSFSMDKLTEDGTIVVTTVPAPSQITGITFVGTDIVLTATGGTPGGAVNVLGSSNLALPINQWSVAQSGSFDANGNLTVSIPVGTEPGPRFFTLQGL